MGRNIKYILIDILKSKLIIGYAVLIGILSWSVFNLEDTSSKGLLTILNVILLTVPLVSIIFSTIYIYNSSEFIELMVSQPIERKKIWLSLFIGLCTAFVVAFLIGAGIPLLVYSANAQGLIMIVIGCLISCVFVAVSFLCATLTKDKAKGTGLAIIIWLFFALLFDGLILFLTFQLSDYPIEKPMVFITALNPIDLSRILMLLQLDASAMMGYTGAIFKKFFGNSFGMIVSFLLLTLWIVIPFYISLKKFRKKDL